MCTHIKPEVKKSDTTAMTAAINEACIGWWDVNYYLMEKERLKEDFSGGGY